MESIQEIEDSTKNINVSTFVENRTLINAVSYGLLKISEAVKNLIRENIDLPSSQPWQDIYNLGNQLRHSYFNIGVERIWQIVIEDLPSLKMTCEAVLVQLKVQKDEES